MNARKMWEVKTKLSYTHNQYVGNCWFVEKALILISLALITTTTTTGKMITTLPNNSIVKLNKIRFLVNLHSLKMLKLISFTMLLLLIYWFIHYW